MPIDYTWRGDFTNDEVNGLHAEGFGARHVDHDWRGRLHRHSLGWVCARDDSALVGFVNVAWDGAAHAFVLDTVTAGSHRHRGVGRALVDMARGAAQRAGCEWLHVDFEEQLGPFYFDACGFVPAPAGLIHLRGSSHPGDGPRRATSS